MRRWPIDFYKAVVGDYVDSAFTSGMEPSAEARKPAFAGPAGRCAGVGLLAGGVLGAAATLADGPGHVVLSFVALGGLLGAALGGFLRGFSDALSIFPGTLTVVIGAMFGATAGGLATLIPGVPRTEALVAGVAVGGVLAALFRVFESRLP